LFDFSTTLEELTMIMMFPYIVNIYFYCIYDFFKND